MSNFENFKNMEIMSEIEKKKCMNLSLFILDFY